MSNDVVITREIPPLPRRADDVHKGQLGRIAIVGGCTGEVTMIGAPALAANAALRSGAGLVRMFVPAPIGIATATLAPCASVRALPTTADALLESLRDYQSEVVAIGPGLGESLSVAVVVEFFQRFEGPIVVDADALNLLATLDRFDVPNPQRLVFTPHSGEVQRLLTSRRWDRAIGTAPAARRAAACALVEFFGCTAVLKGHGTVVTNGQRLYVNETGNSGMATAGTGDVLTGVIAALIGQGLVPFEAAILAVYLHGLAGDFAAEEMGRQSMTALDLIEFLPDAFCEWQNADED